MLEADTSSKKRVRRSGSRGGRTEDLSIGLRPKDDLDDDLNNGLGIIIGTAATSAVRGNGANGRCSEMK
jgi:hypothetical protein